MNGLSIKAKWGNRYENKKTKGAYNKEKLLRDYIQNIKI